MAASGIGGEQRSIDSIAFADFVESLFECIDVGAETFDVCELLLGI